MLNVKLEKGVSPTTLVDALNKAATELGLTGKLKNQYNTEYTIRQDCKCVVGEDIYDSTLFSLCSSETRMGSVYFNRDVEKLNSFIMIASCLDNTNEQKMFQFLEVVSKYL